MLREFLHFAETGKIAAGELTGGEAESPFEEAVAKVIRSNGYRVIPQVGVSGFRIDLGVIDPSQPGRFVLGVECDGAAYHSGRSARDRDRLRHEILVNLGWRLHRIWSTDWFRNPQRETARLLTAIQQACAAAPPAVQAVPMAPTVARGVEPARVEPRIAAHELPAYEECQPPVPKHRDLLAVEPGELVKLTTFVVKAEGPIHAEEVARRIREAFGLGRTGRRILSKINEALQTAERTGEVIREEGFWSAPQRTQSPPRHRRDAVLSLRRADRIAPHEYRLAVLRVIETAVGIVREDLIVETARLLGFDRTGNDLRAAIDKQITTLLQSHRVRSESGYIRLALDNPRAAD